MAGKGYSQQPKGVLKSALKTPLSSGLRQNNGSTKSKKGMNVQFEFEDHGGKGGRGDKVGNGGKNPVKKPVPPVQLRVEKELPENVTCLMDCEAAQVLEGIQERMVVLSEDPTIKIPVNPSKDCSVPREAVIIQVYSLLKKNLKKHGVADREICLIANIHPESADEVFSLVPSLKGKKNKLLEPLNYALGELDRLNVQHNI